ncbi:MAG: hypothetical protein QOE53_2323, partial [Pseudonocardiales bacterium]|jgi:hypothetical protein|nr:hypothetical protein [Pseudonocardiales bacterium]
VYSLGVTLFAMVTGRLPNALADHNGDMTSLETAVLTGVPDTRDIAPQLTLGMARVIATATAVNIADRYASAHQLDAALSKLRTPRRTIVPTTPCDPGGRCWDVTSAGKTKKQPIHVCSRPASATRVQIETRYQGGNRLAGHCAEVTTGRAVNRLKAVFRGLL